jgi:hypothetical protein
MASRSSLIYSRDNVYSDSNGVTGAKQATDLLRAEYIRAGFATIPSISVDCRPLLRMATRRATAGHPRQNRKRLK